MKRLMFASAGTDPVTVISPDGTHNLQGTMEQCDECHQAKIVKGSSVILEIPDGYHVEIVQDAQEEQSA